MINQPTVFIVGAGASKELGFPLGSELLTQIGADLNFQFDADHIRTGSGPLHSDLLRQLGPDKTASLVQAGQRLRSVLSTFTSVDEALHYLSSDPEAVEIGKISIAWQILNAERRSELDENKLDVSGGGSCGFSAFYPSLSVASSAKKSIEHFDMSQSSVSTTIGPSSSISTLHSKSTQH